MKNPDRIGEVLGLVGEIWSKHSDLRFFQLVSVLQSCVNADNEQPSNSDVFYVEDDVLLKSLRKFKETM